MEILEKEIPEMEKETEEEEEEEEEEEDDRVSDIPAKQLCKSVCGTT